MTSAPPRARPRRTPRLGRLAAPLGVLALAAAAVALVPGGNASAADTLLSRGRYATASSTEGQGYVAQYAFDGDPATRWSSQAADPQWIAVDLGTSATVSSVKLVWEAAYARAFQLQTSTDGSTWSTVKSVTGATGGTVSYPVNATGRYVRLYGTSRATGYGYSLWEFEVYGTAGAGGPVTGGPGYIVANPVVTGVTPSTYNPPHAYFHEFQANCSANHSANDDPIVYPGQAGASHNHTFLGNTTTNYASTLSSLNAGGTSCTALGDRTGYWMPTMLNGTTPVTPVGPQVIYYKTGVNDYTSVRPFPAGLRFLVGSATATAAEFLAGSYEGFECGNSYHNADIPQGCPTGTQVNVRYQAPSCWDGRYLDTPNHRDHMAYPVNGVCPGDHPVALPMIEFKMAWPIPANGDTSQYHFSSGRGYSFHYDFFNAWDPATLAALVQQCVNGGLQCNAYGYDESQPGRGRVLDAAGNLIH
jgi:hypothetical protein